VTKVRTVLAMRTREGCEQQFESEWLSAAEQIRTLDGCLHQDLVRDTDDPRSYLVISDWADRERLDAFGRSVHRDRLLQVIRELRESAQRHTYQVLHSVQSEPKESSDVAGRGIEESSDVAGRGIEESSDVGGRGIEESR
jgi:quinol monooxygenase YgiN